MKKSLIFTIILLFIFSFSCTFNLFEGDVETIYKSIKDPAKKIEYAQQILASENSEKIEKIVNLLKTDVEDGFFDDYPDLKTSAQQIVGSLLFAQSGFTEMISSAMTNIVSGMQEEGGETDPQNLINSLADFDGNGTIDESDFDSLEELFQTLAEATNYINDAAQADPDNLDLQLQNVIANFAAAIVEISENLNNEESVQQLAEYLNGESSTAPDFIGEIQDFIDNIVQSIENMQQNSEEGSIYYEIANALSQLFSGVMN